MTDRPVTVIVVAYGRSDLLEHTLSALNGAFRVLVVDNSSEESVEVVSRRHDAEYTDPGANGGFGAGVNVALRALLTESPTDVLLLNPDAVIDSNDVSLLAAVLSAQPEVGMVTPLIVEGDAEEQRALWPFPTPGRMWLEAVGLGRLNRAKDYAVGTVLLLRWEAIEDVGLFDERFFLYAEETDWQRRARNHGWRAVQVRIALARHVGGATSSDPRRRETLFHAGAETYMRKWHGDFGWQIYRAAAVLGAILRGMLLPGSRGVDARSRARLYRQGPRRAAGQVVR
jgi:GT2 family glycosyltransferase